MNSSEHTEHHTAISQRRSQTLSTIAMAAIERMILDGTLKAGERLNEQALADQLGVSRGPIREAARALEKLGLVTAVTNHGVFVREISIDEAGELYDVRAVIFGYLCGLVAEKANRAQTDILYGLIGAMEAAAEAGELDEYYQQNLLFHRHIVDFANHARAGQIYRQIITEISLIRRKALHHIENINQSNVEHKEIFAAIVSNNVAAARTAGENHVNFAHQRWLLIVDEIR